MQNKKTNSKHLLKNSKRILILIKRHAPNINLSNVKVIVSGKEYQLHEKWPKMRFKSIIGNNIFYERFKPVEEKEEN